ncbi:hypothetical protein [Streptomyces sp. NPDC101150]|uniref:hypothetical protein n=1 Tax=Streptomyces sp. NPDC101150 TaxID=3366114 RepID=UPI00382A35E8
MTDTTPTPPATPKGPVEALRRHLVIRKDTLAIGAACGALLACAVLIPVAVGQNHLADHRAAALGKQAAEHRAELKQATKTAYDKGYAKGDPGVLDLPDLTGEKLQLAIDTAKALGHDAETTTPTNLTDSDLTLDAAGGKVCAQKIDDATGTVTFLAVPTYIKQCPKGSENALMPKMPKLTGRSLDKAYQSVVDSLGMTDGTYSGVTVKAVYADEDTSDASEDDYREDYRVCFQSPAAGAPSKGPDSKVTLWVTEEDSCPKKKGGYLDPANDPDAPKPIGEGTYIVGDEIEPGTYKTDGGDNCYWARLTSTSGDLDAIIANGLPQGTGYVTIAPSDKAFETSGCGDWTKTG